MAFAPLTDVFRLSWGGALVGGLTAQLGLAVALRYRLGPRHTTAHHPTHPAGAHAPHSPSDPLAPSGVSPFVNTTWAPSRYECLKLAILGPILVPLRLSLLVSTVLFVATWSKVVLLLGFRADNHSPATSLLLRWPVRAAARITLFALGFPYVAVRGRRAAVAETPILVTNHVTIVDAIVFLTQMSAMPVAEVSNMGNPVIAPILQILQCITVDRTDAASRSLVKDQIRDRAQALMNGEVPGGPILLFPEGSTHHQSTLLHFRVGAFAPGLPVQPVCITYPYQHCDPCWVFSGPGNVELLLRLCSQAVNWVELRYLPVVTPTAADRQDAKAYAERVRRLMADATGRILTDHSVDDVMLQFAAFKLHLPPEAAVVETESLKAFFHVDCPTLKARLQQFAAFDTDRNGALSLPEFLAAFTRFHHRPSPLQAQFLTNFFHRLDVDESGQVDFREWLVGLALRSNPAEGSEWSDTVRFVFNALDANGDGDLSREEFRLLLAQAPHTPTANDLFAAADTGHTGALSFADFYRFLRSEPQYLRDWQSRCLGAPAF